MASTTTWLVVGVVAGVGLGVGAAMLWQRRQTSTQTGVRGPQFTETNVIRDEQGRIITTQTVRGVGAGGAVQSETGLADAADVPIR